MKPIGQENPMTKRRRANRSRRERPRIQITNEEILSDLIYPARAAWALPQRREARRR
jgi:hypothetical protein